MSKPIFIWPVRVYYEDTDAGGVVYHANYLRFFERARTEMLRSFGFEQDALRVEQGVLFAVRSAIVDYLKPAMFNDHLEVTAKITQSKKVSFDFEQSINRNGQLLCSAKFRIASIDALTMKPKIIPPAISEKLT